MSKRPPAPKSPPRPDVSAVMPWKEGDVVATFKYEPEIMFQVQVKWGLFWFEMGPNGTSNYWKIDDAERCAEDHTGRTGEKTRVKVVKR